MDYTETLNDPTLLLGFKELLNDPDSLVVKRTIRVFANVYNHSLRLLSEGKITENTLLNAWPYLSDIIDNIFNMFSTMENEGVLLILVKFLECSIDRHLTSNFSEYSEICLKSREYIKRGLRALKDLVLTPYVGGSVFIVAVKAIIRIACLREDLYEPVTNLVQKLLDSLPPTLFDHNVRSLNKILQLNLFRLLKKSKCPELRKKLIQMMVKTGASRKFLIPWTPKEVVVPKRKLTQQNIDDAILGRISPTVKRRKSDTEESKEEIGTKNQVRLELEATAGPVASGFQFLANLIPKAKKKEEEIIYNKLSLDKVCSLILSNLHLLPDSMPQSFPVDFFKKTVVSEKVDVMRKQLSIMFIDLFDSDQLKLISSSAPADDVAIPKTAIDSCKSKSNPTQLENDKFNILADSDVDMRDLGMRRKEMQDVDMRVISKSNEIIDRPNLLPTVFQPEISLENKKKSEHDSSRNMRTDPRLKFKIVPKKTPSPEGSPKDVSTNKPAVETSNIRMVREDARTQNIILPLSKHHPEIAPKENIRQDPRLASDTLSSRDARRNGQENVSSQIDHNMRPTENIDNNLRLNIKEHGTNQLCQNMGYPGNNQNMHFHNNFHSNNRNFTQRFDARPNNGRFPNYSNRGHLHNYNYPYRRQNSRFQ